MKIQITIITVCYNAEDVIAETIKSVAAQTYDNIEYIIIDGGSRDKTLEIIKQYRNGCVFKLISERDDGIYNAMNKGISVASGDYINFLNAGDVLYDENIVQMIADSAKASNKDIYYGKALYMENGGRTQYIRSASENKYKMYKGLWDRGMPNHQTIFAAKRCLREHYFNEKYKIAADFDWFLKCLTEGCSMEFLDSLIIKFSREGISSSFKSRKLLNDEQKSSIKKNLPIYYYYHKFYKNYFV